jgi:hypothetical protein
MTAFDAPTSHRITNKQIPSNLLEFLFISFVCPKETNQRKGQKIYTEPSHRPLPDTDIFSCLPTFVSTKQVGLDKDVLIQTRFKVI